MHIAREAGRYLVAAAFATAAITPVALPALGTAAWGAPANCTTGVSISISDTVDAGGANGADTPIDIARVGDAIDYQVPVSNGSPGSTTDCPFSNGKVTLTIPSGVVQTLATNLSLASGASQTFSEQTPVYIVKDANVSNGLTVASAAVNGTATESNGFQESVSATTQYQVPVIHPETTLTKAASVTSGTTPLTVTYTFTEKNVSPDTYTGSGPADAITNITVTDSNTACKPVLVSGTGTTLAVGQSWQYSCTVTYSSAGTFTDVATATGTAGDLRSAGTPASDGAPQNETSNQVSVTTTTPTHTAPGGGTTTTTTTTTTTVPGAKPVTASSGHLAFTGADVIGLLGAGIAALAGGFAFLMVSRRRSSSLSRRS